MRMVLSRIRPGAKYEPDLESNSDTRLGTILTTHYKLSFEQCSAKTLDVDTTASFSTAFALGVDATLSAAQRVGGPQSFAGRCTIELQSFNPPSVSLLAASQPSEIRFAYNNAST